MSKENAVQPLSAEEVLMKKYNAEDLEDLQMSITLNPQVKIIVEALEEYASTTHPAEPAASPSSPTTIQEEWREKLKALENEHPYKQIGNPDSYSSYNEGWCDAIDRAEQIFEAYSAELEKKNRELEALTNKK